MTDTSNQNPVQPQSDNPFFRPAANDPAQVVAPDPLTPTQSSPPASTVPDPLASVQNANPIIDTALPAAAPVENPSLSGMPAMQDVTASTLNATTAMEPSSQTNELPKENVIEPMSAPTLDNTLSASVPNPTSLSEPQVAPVSDDLNTASTMPAASLSPVEGSLSGAAPVMPPVESTNMATANVEPAAEASSMPSLSGTVDAPTDTPKEALPDLNTLNTTLPDLNNEAKPLEDNVVNELPPSPSVVEGSNLNQLETATVPAMESTPLGNDLNTPVADPVASAQPEIAVDPIAPQPEPAADPVIAQPEQPISDVVPMASPIAETSPTLPPLEPLVQTEAQANTANVETPVVTPLAQEVVPAVVNEAPQNTNESAPTTEAVPAAGKMKNLVLLLGVLVVGIMALVLGIIVASTQ